jgi:2-oxoglutarate ferredoxin oxidoreductase subunit gamma
MLGAYIAFTGIVDMTAVLDGFEDIFKGRKSATIERNRKAFLTGVEYARNNW